MEVHAHTHSSRKKWTHYLWEFLMLFLAVFCGFLAENFREHQLEHKKEKQYMRTLAEELKYDLEQYKKTLQKITTLHPMLDSLYYNIKHPEQFNYRLESKWNSPVNNATVPYFAAMPTLHQLMNSGNLRLIKQKEIENKIMIYEYFIEKRLAKNGEETQLGIQKIYALEDKYCDYDDFNRKTSINMENVQLGMHKDPEPFEMTLIIKDPVLINEMANSIVNYRAYLFGYYANCAHARDLTDSLLTLLNKQYRLE